MPRATLERAETAGVTGDVTIGPSAVARLTRAETADVDGELAAYGPGDY